MHIFTKFFKRISAFHFKGYRKPVISLIIYLSFCFITFLANYLMSLAEGESKAQLETISGILFAVVAIPVFGIILPLYFANKWKLNFSFWPKSKNIWGVILFILAYLLFANYGVITFIASNQYSFVDYAIHYTHFLLLVMSVYPLFVILLLPVMRLRFGFWAGIVSTSVLFSLYHFSEYYFYPAGTEISFQFFLFVAFLFNILIYLFTESVILVSLMHSFTGATTTLSGGLMFNQPDSMFYIAIIIISLLMFYYTYREIIQRRNKEFDKKWWLRFKKIRSKD